MKRDNHSIYQSLFKLKESNSNQKIDVLLSRYASKVKSYITSKDVVYSFQEAFRSSILAPDVRTSRDRALAQERVTGNMLSELGAQQLAQKANGMMETQDASINELEADRNNDDKLEDDNVLDDDGLFAPVNESPMINQPGQKYMIHND